MIQRIQSLYLLLASLLSGMLFILPLGVFHLKGGNDLMYLHGGIYSSSEIMYSFFLFSVFIGCTGLMSFITIFLFKNRSIQMRLCTYSMLANFLVFASIYFLWFKYNGVIISESAAMYITSVFPLIAIILLFLAYKAIKKDDDLVKSVDRIR